ncbi:MAG: DNA repair protein RecO [Gammaproteobacteria bacterium]|nr:DNA repair protein RecO [Gammaproteobacteria bacterium]
MYRAYLLHRTPYSNSSLLVECFTKEHGRFPAIAKGARAGRKSGAVTLQPFNPLVIRIAGKGEVKTLTGYELESTAPNLQGRSMYCGFYLNELLVRILARNDPHEELFAHYENALIALSSADEIEPALRQFEVALLNELGYGLQLEVEVEKGNPIKPDTYYTYELESGPKETKLRDRNSIMGSTLQALAGNRPFQETERNQARGLMRRILAYYLGDRPLKSRELFTQHFR